MSEVKHTAGPWEAYHVSSAGWSVRRQHERPGYTGLAPICSMAWWQFDIPGIIDDGISEANARLIAASPNLLEACKEARQFIANAIEFGYCKEPEPGTRESKCLGVLDAAINKAEGKVTS